MPGLICVVTACKSKSEKAKKTGDKISFHSFPTNKAQQKVWIARCHRKDKFDIGHKKICSKHFNTDDYVDAIQAKVLGVPPKRLKKNGARGMGNRFDEQRLTVRIHRGRGSSGKRHHGSPHSNGSNSTTTTTGSANASPCPSTRGRHERVKISVSYPSSENVSSPHASPKLLAVTPTSPTGPLHHGQPSYAVHYSANGKDATISSLFKKAWTQQVRYGSEFS